MTDTILNPTMDTKTNSNGIIATLDPLTNDCTRLLFVSELNISLIASNVIKASTAIRL